MWPSDWGIPRVFSWPVPNVSQVSISCIPWRSNRMPIVVKVDESLKFLDNQPRMEIRSSWPQETPTLQILITVERYCFPFAPAKHMAAVKCHQHSSMIQSHGLITFMQVPSIAVWWQRLIRSSQVKYDGLVRHSGGKFRQFLVSHKRTDSTNNVTAAKNPKFACRLACTLKLLWSERLVNEKTLYLFFYSLPNSHRT